MRATAESVDGKFAALACAVLFAAAGVASHAQAPVQGAPAPAAPAPAAAGQPPVAQPSAARLSEFPKVSLTAGRSTVLATDFNITRIAITNPAVADAAVVQPREILIDGKTAGHDQLDRVGSQRSYAVRHRGGTARHGAAAESRDALPW